MGHSHPGGVQVPIIRIAPCISLGSLFPLFPYQLSSLFITSTPCLVECSMEVACSDKEHKTPFWENSALMPMKHVAEGQLLLLSSWWQTGYPRIHCSQFFLFSKRLAERFRESTFRGRNSRLRVATSAPA